MARIDASVCVCAEIPDVHVCCRQDGGTGNARMSNRADVARSNNGVVSIG